MIGNPAPSESLELNVIGAHVISTSPIYCLHGAEDIEEKDYIEIVLFCFVFLRQASP